MKLQTMRLLIIFVISILLINIVSCSSKVQYVDKVVIQTEYKYIKDNITLPKISKCATLYKIDWGLCDNNSKYCINSKEANKLLSNYKLINNCFDNYINYIKTICKYPNIKCQE